jgi:hypothetical protein
MGLLTPKNNKGNKGSAKNAKNKGQESKFISKPGKATAFVKKQGTPGAKRGS